MATSPDFSRLMTEALFALQQAHKLPGITDIERAQASAAAKLVGVTFHKIGVSHPDDKDARAVRADLEHIWTAVDPLILAVGVELAMNFAGVDLAAFTSPVQGALEGNATHECDRAEARAIEDRFGDVLPRYGRSRQSSAMA